LLGRAPAEPVVDAEALKKAEEYIEQEEGASNKLRGRSAPSSPPSRW